MDNSTEPKMPDPTVSSSIKPQEPTSLTKQTSLSHSLITILCIIFLLPVGLILVWKWTNWSSTIKIAVTVLTIIFVIFAAPFVAVSLIFINPKGQFAQANNTKRAMDVRVLITALDEYKKENGRFPANVTTNKGIVAKNSVDICNELVPKYLPALPVDPGLNKEDSIEKSECDSQYFTGYRVYLIDVEKIVVSAPSAEKFEEISEIR